MEGLGTFIYIALGITALLVIASIYLNTAIPEKKEKYLRVAYSGLLLMSIGIVIMSLFVGGWVGMGYGFIGFSILVGTIIGDLINTVTTYYLVKQN